MLLQDQAFFFNYLLALIGGPTFYGFFLYTDYDITTRKRLFQMAENKVETQNWFSAEGTVCLVPVPTPAGAEAARAAATSAAAAEIAPCAAEATALVAASAPTVAAVAPAAAAASPSYDLAPPPPPHPSSR
jgi:hypothetical protein